MDIEFLLLLQNMREACGECFNKFADFIATIAVDYWVFVPVLVLFWAVDKRKGSQVALSLGLSLYINGILKAIFCVYRPWVRDPRVKPVESVLPGATGYSFPSGHSSSAGGFWGGLAFAYKKYKGFVVFCAVMLFIVQISRNYLGVHTPQDVLVGGLLAVLSAFLIDRVLAAVDEKPELDIWVLAGAAILCLFGYFFVRFKSYPMDYVDGKLLVDPAKMTINSFKDPGSFFGFVVGWFLERRFVKFSTDGTPMEKVMRCLVGGMLYIFLQLSFVLPVTSYLHSDIAYFLLFALINIVFMTVYPLLAIKFEARARAKRETKA